MSAAERFWWILTFAGVAWYSTVTVYVAFRGLLDIRQMLRRLEAQQEQRGLALPKKGDCNSRNA